MQSSACLQLSQSQRTSIMPENPSKRASAEARLLVAFQSFRFIHHFLRQALLWQGLDLLFLCGVD